MGGPESNEAHVSLPSAATNQLIGRYICQAGRGCAPWQPWLTVCLSAVQPGSALLNFKCSIDLLCLTLAHCADYHRICSVLLQNTDNIIDVLLSYTSRMANLWQGWCWRDYKVFYQTDGVTSTEEQTRSRHPTSPRLFTVWRQPVGWNA